MNEAPQIRYQRGALEQCITRFSDAIERRDWQAASMWVSRAALVCRHWPEVRPEPPQEANR